MFFFFFFSSVLKGRKKIAKQVGVCLVGCFNYSAE